MHAALKKPSRSYRGKSPLCLIQIDLNALNLKFEIYVFHWLLLIIFWLVFVRLSLVSVSVPSRAKPGSNKEFLLNVEGLTQRFIAENTQLDRANVGVHFKAAWPRFRPTVLYFLATVSSSSACTTKRFPSSRCASAIQIVRPLESIAETQPQLQPALLRLSAALLIVATICGAVLLASICALTFCKPAVLSSCCGAQFASSIRAIVAPWSCTLAMLFEELVE